MKIGNLGILKNLAYGAGIGFFVSLILYFLLLLIATDYYYADEFAKTFHGGGATGIALFLLAQWAHDENSFYKMNLWFGLAAILIFGFTGAFTPLLVLGALASLLSILNALELIDYLLDFLGGFCSGGICVGLVAGLFNHFQKIFD